MSFWIDTHCHLDASEFMAEAQSVRELAASNNVAHCVFPGVERASFQALRQIAHAFGDSYALGIHPLYVKGAHEEDLEVLDQMLTQYRDDPHLVAVGEIGLDFFVPELCESPLRERQTWFYLEQLKLARKHDLPVILHVRRSADALQKGLREIARGPVKTGALRQWRGIAHAFNGSVQQAQTFIDLGFKLGFGGAVTYPRALQLRRLAATLPLSALVLETDAPDMPPRWLYRSAAQRASGMPQARNSPAELPRIGSEIAALRGISVEELARVTTANAVAALPRLNVPGLTIMR